MSDIPFDGPVAGVNVGRVNGEIVINPTVAQAELSDIELTVAGTATAINMVNLQRSVRSRYVRSLTQSEAAHLFDVTWFVP